MKKTLNIDRDLLARAREATGASTDTGTIHKALESVVRTAAYQELRAMLGSEAHLPVYDVPRRREKPVRKRKSA